MQTETFSRYAPPGTSSEDCLTLDLWTPDLDPGAKRPVIVFYHGGGYVHGSGSVPIYDGARFARDGLVAVNPNYRLGSLGFLYLEELFTGFAGSGNLAVLDAIRGLEWIRENIAGFGGDPESITISGSSAGGGMVHSLMASPRATGLFKRAIPMSIGGAWGRNHPSPDEARRARTAIVRTYLELLGVRPGDTEALLALPAERFILGPDVVGALGAPLPTNPLVDGAILTERPLDAIAAGSAADVDLLGGCTVDESGARWTAALSVEEAIKLTDVPLARPAPTNGWDLGQLFPESRTPLEHIKQAYVRSLRAHGRPTEDGDVFSAATSDRMTISAIRVAEAHCRNNPRTYLYRFSWPSPMHGGALGSFHGVPTPFFFDRIDDPAWEPVLGKDPPLELARRYHGAMVSFVTTGDPNHPGLPQWPAYDLAHRSTMDFGVPIRALDDPDADRRRAFDGR